MDTRVQEKYAIITCPPRILPSQKGRCIDLRKVKKIEVVKEVLGAAKFYLLPRKFD